MSRLIRDIRRKIAGRHDVEAAFEAPLARASHIRSQQQRQRGWKLYSFHAPETECIGRGKASAPYEFGVKASIVTTNRRAPAACFVLHAKSLPGNPNDGHTLRDVIEDTQSSPAARSSAPMSTKDTAVTIAKIQAASSSRDRSAASSAPSSANCSSIRRIEPVIGHMKAEGHLGRMLPQRPRAAMPPTPFSPLSLTTSDAYSHG